MKRLFCFLIAALVFLCSCGEPSESHDAFFDTYLLTDMRVGNVITPALFNLTNGSTLPLCFDPICDHTEKAGCPFSGYCQIFKMENGKLYYSTNVLEKKSDGIYLGTAYRVYDIETGTVNELCRKTEPRMEGSISSVGSISGDWQYICQSGDTEYYYRVNYKTGKIEDLSHLDEVFLPVYEDESYLYIPITSKGAGDAGTGIARVDHNFEEQEILFDTGELLGNIDFSKAESEYIYYFTLNSDSYNLYRYSLKHKETELILENILYAIIGENAIYFTKAAENPEHLYYDEWRKKDMYDTIDGKIYSCSLDGRKTACIFESDELILRAIDMQYKNGYLICDFGEIVEKEFKNGEMKPWLEANRGGKIVIDVKTGEASVYKKTQ